MTALELKKQQVSDYFEYHPDMRVVTVDKDGRTFPALFDKSYGQGGSSKAQVTRKSYVPHLTCFTDNVGGIVKDDLLSFSGVQYGVYRVSEDKTEETFQAEIWLKVV